MKKERKKERKGKREDGGGGEKRKREGGNDESPTVSTSQPAGYRVNLRIKVSLRSKENFVIRDGEFRLARGEEGGRRRGPVIRSALDGRRW